MRIFNTSAKKASAMPTIGFVGTLALCGMMSAGASDANAGVNMEMLQSHLSGTAPSHELKMEGTGAPQIDIEKAQSGVGIPPPTEVLEQNADKPMENPLDISVLPPEELVDKNINTAMDMGIQSVIQGMTPNDDSPYNPSSPADTPLEQLVTDGADPASQLQGAINTKKLVNQKKQNALALQSLIGHTEYNKELVEKIFNAAAPAMLAQSFYDGAFSQSTKDLTDAALGETVDPHTYNVAAIGENGKLGITGDLAASLMYDDGTLSAQAAGNLDEISLAAAVKGLQMKALGVEAGNITAGIQASCDTDFKACQATFGLTTSFSTGGR